MTSEPHRVRRLPERASYDPRVIREILAGGRFCHVGFVDGTTPVVIPTAYGLLDLSPVRPARASPPEPATTAGPTSAPAPGELEIVVHGLPASRLLGVLRAGAPVCVTVTLLDGLVLARSAFEHSMNYRSVVVFGQARWLRDLAEKTAALRAISEQLLPGRWDDVRPPDESELRRTHVLAIPLDRASAKMRSGPPSPEDDDWDTWTGVLPASTGWVTPEPAPGQEGRPPPGYLRQATAGRSPADQGHAASPPASGPAGRPARD